DEIFHALFVELARAEQYLVILYAYRICHFDCHLFSCIRRSCMNHAEKVEPPVGIYRPSVAMAHLRECGQLEPYLVDLVFRHVPDYHAICDKACIAVAQYGCK